MNLRTAVLGFRPFVLVELHDGEAELDLGGVSTVAEGLELIRQARHGLRLARRELVQKRRQERKLARLEKRALRDFDAERTGASSSLEVAE
ncbi:hypothetical protein SEA_MABODAMACA_29 [Microbacterium phage Mabodamaca]|uniref:Uncharacterized protein n=1 Tax=Microbacterium phage Mabodamaca TaxID=3078574 RepID=A0AA96NEM2_9CAUD|nr:hypothetical protein SEA_MABODAMACA_29 [Microbacterium phage Mabodamaca]